MAIITCKNCDNQFDDATHGFCPKCGMNSSAAPKKKSLLWLWILLGIFIGLPILLIGGCFILFAVFPIY